MFHPNGRIVYLLTEHAVTIHVYDYDVEKGKITDYPVGKNPNWIEIVEVP